MTEEKAYLIGYKKPPRHTQFKLGQSGNPKGRPVGTLNLKTDLEQELTERIRIREGDRSMKVSKQRALLKALVAKALKGDTKAANLVLQLVAKVIMPTTPVDVGDDDLSEDEAAIVNKYIQDRLTERAAETTNEGEDGSSS